MTRTRREREDIAKVVRRDPRAHPRYAEYRELRERERELMTELEAATDRYHAASRAASDLGDIVIGDMRKLGWVCDACGRTLPKKGPGRHDISDWATWPTADLVSGEMACRCPDCVAEAGRP